MTGTAKPLWHMPSSAAAREQQPQERYADLQLSDSVGDELADQGKVSDQTARRRLEDLRAAVNAYHAEHTLSVVPKITLPPKSEGRHRWLTRNEAARLLGAAVGYVWDSERNSWKRKEDGKLLRRERWIIRRRYPAARFCLI